MKKLNQVLALVLGAGLSGAALAVPVAISTTDAVDQLGLIGGAVAAIGGALLVAAGIAIAFKWAKAAIFG